MSKLYLCSSNMINHKKQKIKIDASYLVRKSTMIFGKNAYWTEMNEMKTSKNWKKKKPAIKQK